MVECIIYDEWISDWHYHKASKVKIDFKPNSLNVIMPPSGGAGTSKTKKAIKEFGDNSQHVAMREAHSRREAWELYKELHPSPAKYHEACDAFFVSAPGHTSPDSVRVVRSLIMDSGASQHMLCEKHLTPAEKESIRPLDKPLSIHTANGKVRVTKSCKIWVHELGMSVPATVLPDTADVLSLGILVTQNGFSYYWIHGQRPYLEKKLPDGGGTIRVYCEVFTNVPYCIAGQRKMGCLKVKSSFEIYNAAVPYSLDLTNMLKNGPGGAGNTWCKHARKLLIDFKTKCFFSLVCNCVKTQIPTCLVDRVAAKRTTTSSTLNVAIVKQIAIRNHSTTIRFYSDGLCILSRRHIF